MRRPDRHDLSFRVEVHLVHRKHPLVRLRITQRVSVVNDVPIVSVLPAQQQIRQHKLPLFIRNVGPVRPTNNFARHSMLASKGIPEKNLLRCKRPTALDLGRTAYAMTLQASVQ